MNWAWHVGSAIPVDRHGRDVAGTSTIIIKTGRHYAVRNSWNEKGFDYDVEGVMHGLGHRTM